jgi:hypothetical protein
VPLGNFLVATGPTAMPEASPFGQSSGNP